MPEYIDDATAWPHLGGLLSQVGEELELRNLPELCDSFTGPGSQVAFDTCSTDCGGMSFARLAGAYPSQNFPDQDAAVVRGVILMAETFELGIVRGIALPEDPADGMDPDVLQAAAELQLADMSGILAAICAYFGTRLIPYVIGTYTPYGPEGGCVGGWWQVTAQTGVAPR